MKKMNECLYIEKDMNKCPNFAPWYPDKKDGRCLWVDMDNKKVCYYTERKDGKQKQKRN